MTEIDKQILDKLDGIDKKFKKSEWNNNVTMAINVGLVAMIFSTRFFTIEPNIGTAWLLFIGGVLAITAYGWYLLLLSLKKKLCKPKK